MYGRTHNLKSTRLAKRRRRAFVGRAFFAIFCLAGIWGAIYLLAGLKAITISNLDVSGAVSVPPAQITATAQPFLEGRYFSTVPKANIIFYPKSEIEKKILESFPQINRVDIGFENLHSIQIKISERVAEALWCQVELETAGKTGKENCFALDNGGFIFAPAPSIGSTTPAFIKFYSDLRMTNPIGQTYTHPEYFQSLLGFAKDLNSLGFQVSAFVERADADFEAKLSTGSRLIFGRSADFSSILSNFKTIVSEPSFGGPEALAKIDYIDLRYGNKVFYKPR